MHAVSKRFVHPSLFPSRYKNRDSRQTFETIPTKVAELFITLTDIAISGNNHNVL